MDLCSFVLTLTAPVVKSQFILILKRCIGRLLIDTKDKEQTDSKFTYEYVVNENI